MLYAFCTVDSLAREETLGALAEVGSRDFWLLRARVGLYCRVYLVAELPLDAVERFATALPASSARRDLLAAAAWAIVVGEEELRARAAVVSGRPISRQ